MKTPEAIKYGLKHCRSVVICDIHCEYYPEKECEPMLLDDALAYIEQLEKELTEARNDMVQLMEDFQTYRERNIKRTCGVYACDLCKFGGDPYTREEDIECPEGCDGMRHWTWRGMPDKEGQQ